MARYPTFEEYAARENYGDGIKRCDELLEKAPDDVQLLATKFRLLSATRDSEPDDEAALLDKLASSASPLDDLDQLVGVETAAVESQSGVYPPITTAGPQVAKLWDTAVKGTSSLRRKIDFLSTRWERAVFDNRTVDMQQSLIQLKALQPNTRAIYMAHAALTQMLSQSKDDLQGRLALSLARKAVKERFDDDKTLDCRVPGQIFAMQQATEDLESIKDRPFRESKQVYDALRATSNGHSNGTEAWKLQAPDFQFTSEDSATEVKDPATLPARDWLANEIAALKMHFATLVESKAPEIAIRSFACNAIRLFHTAVTSLSAGARRLPADACFLAISALVKLFEQRQETQLLLHAAYLAERLLHYDEHVHEARLILVYLYMSLSCGSLAIRMFESLSVKEIQHDTIGQVLFSRLSLTHPFPTALGKKDNLDPVKRLAHALGVYVRHEGHLADTEANILNHGETGVGFGQTGMVFDLHELRTSLRKSVTRRISILEWRRTARLTQEVREGHEVIKEMGPPAVENWLQYVDNRDFNAAFDYGYNVERPLHGRAASIPGKAWILSALAADCAWCLSVGLVPMVIDEVNIVSQWNALLSDLPKDLPQESVASTLGLTAAEFVAGEVACHALRLILLWIQSIMTDDSGTRKLDLETVSAVAVAIQRLNVDALVATQDALAERLLDHYAYADVLRIVVACCKSLKKTGTSSQTVGQLQVQATQLFSQVQKHASQRQAEVNAVNVKQCMSQDERIWETLQLFGGSMNNFCEIVAKSAKEGWEGVSKIKLA